MKSRFLGFATLMPTFVAALFLFPLRIPAQTNFHNLRVDESCFISGNGGQSSSFDSGQVTNTNSISAATPFFTSSNSSGSESVSTSYGALAVSASMLAFGPDSQNHFGDAQIQNAIGGTPQAAFYDVLNISSATLSPGTAVQVQLTCVHKSSVAVSIAGSGTNITGWGASGAFYDEQSNLYRTNSTFTNGTVTNTFTKVMNTAVGGSFGLADELYASASAFTGSGSGNATSFSAIMNLTSQVYVDVLTAGAAYNSASGTTYPRLVVSRPQLSIKEITNGVMLFWPASATGFRLQQNNSDISKTDWAYMMNPTNVVNGTNQVTISPASGGKIYRLSNP